MEGFSPEEEEAPPGERCWIPRLQCAPGERAEVHQSALQVHTSILLCPPCIASKGLNAVEIGQEPPLQERGGRVEKKNPWSILKLSLSSGCNPRNKNDDPETPALAIIISHSGTGDSTSDSAFLQSVKT